MPAPLPSPLTPPRAPPYVACHSSVWSGDIEIADCLTEGACSREAQAYARFLAHSANMLGPLLFVLQRCERLAEWAQGHGCAEADETLVEVRNLLRAEQIIAGLAAKETA